MAERNVLGGDLVPWGTDAMTGFSGGSCSCGPQDVGLHAVCAVMTSEFLAQQRSVGNGLTPPTRSGRSSAATPRPLVRRRGAPTPGPPGRVRGAGGAGLH